MELLSFLLEKEIFKPDQLGLMLQSLFWFALIFLSFLLGLFLWYVYTLSSRYTALAENIFQSNKEGGVLHEFSHGWIKGFHIKPILPSPKKEKGAEDSPINNEKGDGDSPIKNGNGEGVKKDEGT